MVIHHICDAQHVPFCLQLVHQRSHICPAIALTLWTELWVKGQLVSQRITGPGLSQSLQRCEVNHVVSWDRNTNTHMLLLIQSITRISIMCENKQQAILLASGDKTNLFSCQKGLDHITAVYKQKKQTHLTPWLLSVCAASRPNVPDIWTDRSGWWCSPVGGRDCLLQHGEPGRRQCILSLTALCLCGKQNGSEIPLMCSSRRLFLKNWFRLEQGWKQATLHQRWTYGLLTHWQQQLLMKTT